MNQDKKLYDLLINLSKEDKLTLIDILESSKISNENFGEKTLQEFLKW